MAHPNRQKRITKGEMKREEEEHAKRLLTEHNKEYESKPARKKSPSEIIKLIRKDYLVPSKYIRDPNDWVTKSYNLNRQRIDFVKWIYCLYSVPQFMFELFLEDIPKQAVKFCILDNLLSKLVFFDWFITMAQGGSFAKMAKELLTKKEAHLFFNAPSANSITNNVWWAKCHAISLDDTITHAVVNRLFRGLDVTDAFWHYFIVLLKNNEDIINLESLSDITDFLRAKHARDKEFILKGRTFNSLVRLSNEWHREMQLKKFGEQNIYWDGVDIQDWSWKDKQEKVIWRVKQLHTSKELYFEGRKMKHCVASYGQRCAQGSSAIFTLMSDDGINKPEKFLTIEISSGKRFVQARGRMNKWPEGRPKLVLNKWIGTNGIMNY